MIRVRLTASALLTVIIILLLLTAGCEDVKATQKVGDFGTAFGSSTDEKKVTDWFKATYGDPMSNNDQPARFVEPLITTGIGEHDMPVDKVTTFPVNGGSIYYFVVYDNFKKGDPITVSWIYLVNNREVTKVEKQAGADFGRFIVEFQKPDSGWGKGSQKITISGNGASKSMEFVIGDTLQTTPLPYDAGSSGSTAGAKATTTLVPITMTKQTIVGQAGITMVATITPTKSSADTSGDVNNCGKTGYVCPDSLNTDKKCVAGTCSYTCLPGWASGKNFDPALGCKYNTNIDPYNCGKFNNVCGGGIEPGYGDRCVGGVCTCVEGGALCNGKCRDLQTESSNCGACGLTCPPGMGCSKGICKPSAQAICSDIPCPPLKHCEVQSGAPVCIIDSDACSKIPCPPLFHCEVSSIGVPACVPGT